MTEFILSAAVLLLLLLAICLFGVIIYGLCALGCRLWMWFAGDDT